MARVARDIDLQPGKYVHYWGQNRQVLGRYGDILSLTDDYSPFKRIMVCLPNEFILCFDEIKRDIFGREIR